MITRFDEDRIRFGDDPRMLAAIDRDERIATNAPAVPPCPAWCVRPDPEIEGKYVSLTDPHPYDLLSDDERVYSRFHLTKDDGGIPGVIYGLSLAQEEFNDGDAVTFGPLHICGLDGLDDAEHGLSAEQARRLAASLLNAADRLDELARS